MKSLSTAKEKSLMVLFIFLVLLLTPFIILSSILYYFMANKIRNRHRKKLLNLISEGNVVMPISLFVVISAKLGRINEKNLKNITETYGIDESNELMQIYHKASHTNLPFDLLLEELSKICDIPTIQRYVKDWAYIESIES